MGKGKKGGRLQPTIFAALGSCQVLKICNGQQAEVMWVNLNMGSLSCLSSHFDMSTYKLHFEDSRNRGKKYPHDEIKVLKQLYVYITSGAPEDVGKVQMEMILFRNLKLCSETELMPNIKGDINQESFRKSRFLFPHSRVQSNFVCMRNYADSCLSRHGPWRLKSLVYKWNPIKNSKKSKIFNRFEYNNLLQSLIFMNSNRCILSSTRPLKLNNSARDRQGQALPKFALVKLFIFCSLYKLPFTFCLFVVVSRANKHFTEVHNQLLNNCKID